MANFIVEKFNKIVYEACERFGVKNGVGAERMQLLFNIEDDEVLYKLMKDYVKVSELTFNEILNVRMDFRGYSLIVPHFIKQTLSAYAEEMKVPVEALSVMCIVREKSVYMCLYKGTEYVKQIDLEEEL